MVEGEKSGEDFLGGQVFMNEEVVEGKGKLAGRGVLELGVNDETNEVADYEDGRIFEAFVILVELLVGLIEVSAFGLAFPGEEAAPPHVGEADVVSACFGDALFVGIACADVVILGGMGHAEDFAEIAEVGLGTRFSGKVLAFYLLTKYWRSVGMG